MGDDVNIAAENVPTVELEAVDVVVSYASADSLRVETLVKALRDAGLKVWRAEPERNGNRWRDESEDRIEAARAVVAVWSKDSVRTSSNVFEDAKLALDDAKLIAVTIDGATPPLGFRHVAVIDLKDDSQDVGLIRAAIARLAGAAKPQDATLVEAEEGATPGDTLKTLVNAVMTAALVQQRDQLVSATQAVAEALTRSGESFPPKDGEELLTALRDQRAHDSVVTIAEALLTRGDASIKMRRLYAQSLIDSGKVNVAIDHLKSALDRVGTGESEYVEVLGLLGRAHKQLFVNDERMPKSDQALEALRLALVYYGEAVVTRTKLNAKTQSETGDDVVRVENDIWNGINLMALQAMAAREGLAVPTYCNPVADAPKLIAAIQAGKIGPWEEATLGEAHVALGKYDKAAAHYGTFLANDATTMFQKYSALRQLREIWQLKPGPDSAGQLLGGFETKFAAAKGGGLQMNATAIDARIEALGVQSMPVYDAVLQASTIAFGPSRAIPETIIGHHAAKPADWFKTMLQRAQSVGRVNHPSFGTIGTGFLMRAGDLDPKLGDELIFVTNAHVVTGGRAERGLQRALGIARLPNKPAMAQEITVAFDEAETRGSTKNLVCDLIWESPVAELDVALLRFKRPVRKSLRGLPIAEELPPLKVQSASQLPQDNGTLRSRTSRVFIIGHPGGRGLSVSMDGCSLLQKGPKVAWGDEFAHLHFLHYRTPTEGGNSGSPVFEEVNWSVVGVHHFGLLGDKIPSLDGKKLWRANEGVSIFSIRDAVQKAVAAGEIKPRPA
ncbi:MAG: TIR domain-containing protein [Hyphomicrobiaceae bacterium]